MVFIIWIALQSYWIVLELNHLKNILWSLLSKILLGTCASAEFINPSYKAEFTVIWSQNHLIMPQNNLYITWKWKISYPHAPQSSALSPQVTSSIQNLLLRNNWLWHHCFKEINSDQGPRSNWNLGPNRTRTKKILDQIGFIWGTVDPWYELKHEKCRKCKNLKCNKLWRIIFTQGILLPMQHRIFSKFSST